MLKTIMNWQLKWLSSSKVNLPILLLTVALNSWAAAIVHRLSTLIFTFCCTFTILWSVDVNILWAQLLGGCYRAQACSLSLLWFSQYLCTFSCTFAILWSGNWFGQYSLWKLFFAQEGEEWTQRCHCVGLYCQLPHYGHLHFLHRSTNPFLHVCKAD